MNFPSIFAEIWPVLQKAAPLLCASLDTPIAKVACGILAVVAGANPHDHEEIADKLSNDPDLYTKLSSLESTHGEWLKYLEASN